MRLFGTLMFLWGTAAWAQITYLDPATLHMGPGTNNAACDKGGCPQYNGETNAYSGRLDIYQNQGGAQSAQDPVLLILGVPNDATHTVLSGSTLTSVTLYHDPSTNPPTGGSALTFSFGDPSNAFGLPNGTAGYQAQLTSTSTHDAYGLLNLGDQATDSNNWTNWSTWDLAVNGITVNPTTGFGLYVFALHVNTSGLIFDEKDFIDILLSGVPKGTFAIAYAKESPTNCDTSKKNCNLLAFETPFTEAGLSPDGGGPPQEIPEPASIFLLGSGLLGAAALLRKRLAERS